MTGGAAKRGKSATMLTRILPTCLTDLSTRVHSKIGEYVYGSCLIAAATGAYSAFSYSHSAMLLFLFPLLGIYFHNKVHQTKHEQTLIL